MTRVLRAPRSAVYGALLDANAIEQWRVPDDMTSEVHELDARVGGRYRVSLTYRSKDAAGKTSAHTDTHHGVYVELIPDTKIVERVEFETNDPALQGEMTITWELADADGGTRLTATHEGVPDVVPAADNELGWKMSLDKLQRFVERP